MNSVFKTRNFVSKTRNLYQKRGISLFKKDDLLQYESDTDRGYLMDVHKAASRGAKCSCDHCGKSGATVGCQKSNCKSNFHFICALKTKSLFLHSKKVYCNKHKQSAYCDSRELRTNQHFKRYAGGRKVLVKFDEFVYF